MRSLFFTLLFIFGLATIQAQHTGYVSGKILDEIQQPMYGAKCKLFKSDSTSINGTFSDVNGQFKIANLSDGSYFIQFSQNMDYAVNTRYFTIDQGQPVELTIQMQLNPNMSIQEVHIKADRRAMTSSVQLLQVSSVSNVGSRNKYKPKAPVYHNTEAYSKIDENAFKKVKNDPLSTFSIDVDRASYSNVRRYLNQGALPPKDAVRIEEMLNYFPYAYSAPTNEQPYSVQTTYTECPWNKEHQLLHIALQGKEVNMQKAAPNNLIFLIDVSGSMNSPDKLDLLKAGLYLLVDQMREEDKVSIVVYAGYAGLLLPPTSGYEKNKIKGIIENLMAGGSTAGGQGIELAYKTAKDNFIQNGNNRVILATDGDFNVGISSEGDLIRLIEAKRDENIYLSVLGFGTGNIQDSKMKKLASHGNGNYNYIDNIMEAKKVLVDEMGGTLLTIAKDVKLQLEFNPKHVDSYRLIGYEHRVMDNEDFNNDKKDGGDMGSGHSVTAVYEIIPKSNKNKIEDTVDPLKYQTEHTDKNDPTLSQEIATIKLRHKVPGEMRSKAASIVVQNNPVPLDSCSEDVRFALAVIEFGMLLRDSEHKGTSNYANVIELAKKSLGDDKGAYRKEFIALAMKAQELKH
jgi:Ca-activated chloride channel family protein